MTKKDFDKFYRKNIDRIYRYVFFRVGQNHAVCEDLVSEIFMKALKNFDTYDPKISQSAWIYRIASNHLSNHYRDQKSHVPLEDVQFSLKGSDGNDELVRAHSEHVLREGLDQLEANERELVTMKHLCGYTYAEMAQMQDKSLSAVKMATHRAMQKLKSHLSVS